MEFLELISQGSSPADLNLPGDGRRLRGSNDPAYRRRLAEAATLVADVYSGRRRPWAFSEAMSTSDFPLLFGDILDRQILAQYAATPQTWPAYAERTVVPDFRQVKRRKVDGAEAAMDVVPELSEYPETKVTVSEIAWQIAKYGRRIAFSWETSINDDMQVFQSFPQRFANAARRTEELFATRLYVGVNGPNGAVYSTGNGNIVTGNPPLTTAGLAAAMTQIAAARDSDGSPIFIEQMVLVVGPALEVTANNILNALQIEMNDQGGGANQRLIARNWLATRAQVVVNPYIPVVATTNAATTWFLFAAPGATRPALQMGFLRGNEQPAVFLKDPSARRVGAGVADPFEGDFDSDAIEYKVRHVLGGGVVEVKATVASNGTGV